MNPKSRSPRTEDLPNEFNGSPRVTMLSEDGEFIAMVSQAQARLMFRENTARLVIDENPTIVYTGREVVRTDTGWVHALKSDQHYGNILFQSPEGVDMFRSDQERAIWYINRGLVKVVSKDPPVFQFKFVPAGGGHQGDSYYLSEKKNVCVVCGSTGDLSRHHVLPYFYRRHLPLELKQFSYMDVVLTCIPCHEKYEDLAGKFRKLVNAEYGLEPLAEQPSNKPYLDHVKAARAILDYGHKIPPDRIAALKKTVASYLQREPTPEDLTKLVESHFARRPGRGKVVLTEESVKFLRENCQEFTRRWRQHFLETMQPKYMPEGWSIDKPLMRSNLANK